MKTGSRTMELDRRLVLESSVSGITIRHILLTGRFSCHGEDGDLHEEDGRPYYGVSLEKVDENGFVTDEARSGGITFDLQTAERILSALRDLEVTPLSFFDVIDSVVEMAEGSPEAPPYAVLPEGSTAVSQKRGV